MVEEPAAAAAPAAFYVSPSGSDSNPGTADLPFRTLARAQQAVREVAPTMTSDVTVTLAGGTYRLDGPLTLDARDSGRHGHTVVWRAAAGETAVVSGARQVTGWQVHDADKGIWKAHVGTGVVTRQLYVNGRRAIRAQQVTDPRFWTKTSTGFTYTGGGFGPMQNQQYIEVVGLSQWKDHHCRVASISGTTWTIQEPCFTRATTTGGGALTAVNLVENAYELINVAREWYLDEVTGWLYYKPDTSEDMATATIELPVTQSLLDIRGTAAEPVRNVRFEGLTFAYAGWTDPSSAEGYVAVQAGHRVHGDPPAAHAVPAHVTVTYGRSIDFVGNTFTHLGGVALAMRTGSQNNVVSRNTFTDVSNSGIYLAGPADPTDPRAPVQNVTIADNTIDHVAVEYTGAVGIYVSYANGLRIEHNLVQHVPYTGISVGWGWSSSFTYAGHHWIARNKIVDVLMPLPHGRMADGGHIYALGRQPGTMVYANYLVNNNGGTYAGLYLDEGSSAQTWKNNVVTQVSRWLHIHLGCSNIVTGNWTSTSNQRLESTCSNSVTGTTVVTDGNWPQAARDIMALAGPRSGSPDPGNADENLGDVLSSGPDVTAVADAAGYRGLAVFYRGPDDHLYQRSFSADPANRRWLDPVDLGWLMTGDPAVTSRAPQTLDVVMVGDDGRLHHASYSAGKWTKAPIPDAPAPDGSEVQIIGSPDITHRDAATLDLVIRRAGTYESLWRTWTATEGWGPWKQGGGQFSSDLTITSRTTGLLDIFGVGFTGNLYQRAWQEGRGWVWSGWQNKGGVNAGDPDTGFRDANHLDVYVRDIHNRLSIFYWIAGEGWRTYYIGNAMTSDPACASMETSRIDVFYRGPDGTLRHRWWNGAWRP